MSVRARLACLVLACVLPVWLAAGLMLHHAYLSKRTTVEQGMGDMARAMSRSVDLELGRIQAGLETLATSPSLQIGDMPSFHRQTQDVQRLYPEADIVLADAAGQQVVNSFVTYGTLLPKRGVLESVRKVFAEGHPVISGLFLGAVTGRPLAGIDVPVRKGETVVYDLAMTVPAERIGRIVHPSELPPQYAAAIVDAKGLLVARSSRPEDFVGKKVGPDLLDALTHSPEGVLERVNMEGVEVLEAYSTSAATGWTVVVGLPKATLIAELRSWLSWMITGAGLVSILGLGLAMLVARTISRPIQALIHPAHALGRGELVKVEPLPLEEADEVAQALGRASEVLRRHEAERDAAVQQLAEHAQMLQRQYESLRALNDIAALPEEDRNRQIVDALAVGVGHLGLAVGVLARVENHRYTVLQHFSTPGAGIQDGEVFDLGATYCSLVVERGDVVAIPHMSQSRYNKHPCFATFGYEAYIGAPVNVRGQHYGTLSFAWKKPFKRRFDEGDREFMRLLARWVGVTLERQMTHEELNRSNAELEQFAYVASHDLREPLRQVSSYVTLLERRYTDKLDDDANQCIAFARDGAKRMDRLIHDLLEYARIGRRNHPMAPVDLAEVLADVVATLSVALADVGGKVEVAEGLPTVFGERSELLRLFQNLIGNALKYRAPDRAPEVTVGVTRQGEQWVIAVKDNGIGIAPENRERIFGLFQRLHGRQEYEGTGIGLAICKKIVEQHGGDIRIDGATGEGSTFSVVLPVIAE
jgi:signal transduction histidine kinase